MEKITEQLYYDTEKIFFENLQQKCGNDLLFYCVTGSVSRQDVIVGWSDIDIVLVFMRWGQHTFKNLSEALGLNTSSIKIGTTFYSLAEFNSYTYFDPKTFNIIRNIKKGHFVPRLHHPSVILPELDEISVKEVNKVDLTKMLHTFKRELLLFPNYNERTVYKMLTTMLRILLITEKDVTPDGYKAIWEEAKARFATLSLPVLLPQEIILRPDKSVERYTIFIRFLSWIEQQRIA